MKKLTVLVCILGVFITIGCTCQYEGAYEECLQRGGALCLDIYPKCEPK